jgi:predicted transcriptional regulator
MDTKKRAAQTLFNDGIPQQEIAQLLGVSNQTITAWKKRENWKSKREQLKNIEFTNEDIMRQLIHYQLTTLKKTINDPENIKDPKLISKGDIDALSKLYATIKKKDMVWTNYVKVIRELIQYINSENLSLSKQLMEYTTKFLNSKRDM